MSAATTSKQKKGKRSTVKRAIIFIWSFFFGSILLLAGLFLAVSQGLFGKLPTFEQLENPKSLLATEIYSSDGELLGNFFKENRSNVSYTDLSPALIEALVTTEDRRFHNHTGIDTESLFRVIIKNVILGQSQSGGGSTITQQLAKNLFHEPTGSKLKRIIQKLKEWVISTRLEKRYTKEEIIAMYLNTVEFVNNAHGIKSASRVYFNTTTDSLKTEEAALLVGMVKNPSLYNPVRFPDRAKSRRNVVLGQMVKYGSLDPAIADSLSTLELGLNYQPVDHNIGLAPYFRESLRQFMTEWAANTEKIDGSKYDIYRDGLKIYTTIDSRMQRYAEEAVKEHLTMLQDQFFNHWAKSRGEPWNYDRYKERYNPNFIKDKMVRTERYRSLKSKGMPDDSIEIVFNTPVAMKVFSWKGDDLNEKDTMMSPWDSLRYYAYILQSGFMAADPKTGEILAWVGGIDHRYFQLDHVRTRRQVGSTFKPFVYTVAIKDIRYSPCQQFANIDYPNTKYKNWTPRNSSDYKEGQKIELRDALAHSVNKITAKLMLDIGDPNNVIKLVRDMGITSPIPAVPSIALGTCDLTVMEMIGAYTTYVNEGIYSKPYFITRIEDKYGNVIEEFSPEQKEIFKPEVAYVMLQFLQDVVKMGTGRRLIHTYKLTNQIGGKTGTTQENTDGWFMGVVPELVSAVWVGADDPVMRFRYTSLGQGAHMALPIYGLFMNKVYNDESLHLSKEATFKKPAERMTIETDCDKYKQNAYSPYDDL